MVRVVFGRVHLSYFRSHLNVELMDLKPFKAIWWADFCTEAARSEHPSSFIRKSSADIANILKQEPGLEMLVQPFRIELTDEATINELTEFFSDFLRVSALLADAWGDIGSPLMPGAKESVAFLDATEELIDHIQVHYLCYLKRKFEDMKRDAVSISELEDAEINGLGSVFGRDGEFDAPYVKDRLNMSHTELGQLREMRTLYLQRTNILSKLVVGPAQMVAFGRLTAIREYLDKLRPKVTKQSTRIPDYTHPDYRYKLPIRKVGADGVERSNQQLVKDINTAWSILSDGKFIDCPPDTFLSIFHPDEPLIPGARWIGTKKELRYFICNLHGKTFRALVKKSMRDVQAFDHHSIFRDEIPSSGLPKKQVNKCFLDKDGAAIKEKSFVNDGAPEPIDGTAEWTEVHSQRNILDQAAQALRGH